MRRRIKAMSYGLAYGLSAFGLAQQLGITPDEAREQMDAYFARFGGVRDYLTRRRRRGPRRTATPRRSSAAAATCPTSPATTGSAARWPSGWRSTPRSRAPPPTSSRSRCSTSQRALRAESLHVAVAAAGARRAGARGRHRRARPVEALVRREMAGAYELGVAARRLGRLRPHLGRRRPRADAPSLVLGRLQP